MDDVEHKWLQYNQKNHIREEHIGEWSRFYICAKKEVTKGIHSKMADHIVPPSGEWSGFYSQNGERNYFTMHLYFSSSSAGVHGQCADDEVLNYYN